MSRDGSRLTRTWGGRESGGITVIHKRAESICGTYLKDHRVLGESQYIHLSVMQHFLCINTNPSTGEKREIRMTH
mgnify:CR=1 FL=1